MLSCPEGSLKLVLCSRCAADLTFLIVTHWLVFVPVVFSVLCSVFCVPLQSQHGGRPLRVAAPAPDNQPRILMENLFQLSSLSQFLQRDKMKLKERSRALELRLGSPSWCGTEVLNNSNCHFPFREKFGVVAVELIGWSGKRQVKLWLGCARLDRQYYLGPAH